MSLTSVDDLPLSSTTAEVLGLSCPECGQVCKDSTGLGVHRSVKHGYKGAKKLRHKRKVATATDRVLRATPKARRKPVDPEEIVQTVTQMLWPQGVPPKAMQFVLRWYAQTAEFLELASPEILDP
jgi:uncharacterized C2H2 Zn-finger protein